MKGTVTVCADMTRLMSYKLIVTSGPEFEDSNRPNSRRTQRSWLIVGVVGGGVWKPTPAEARRRYGDLRGPW